MEDNNAQHNAPCYLVLDLRNRIDKMEAVVGELDKRTAVDGVLLTKVVQAFEKNTDAINSIEQTMVAMNKDMSSMNKDMGDMKQQIQNNAETTQQLVRKIDEAKVTTETINLISAKVNKLDENFRTSEEKAKIDFRDIFKNIFTEKLSWLLGGGAIVVLIDLLRRIDWTSLLK